MKTNSNSKTPEKTKATMSKSSEESRKHVYRQMGTEKKVASASASATVNPSDEDYEAGVTYPCKYIGSMSLMKPSRKDEILAAMRRVRFEYKSRNTKKKKVVMEIGLKGVKVYLNKRRKRELMNASNKDLLLMEEPIYHIFFVSHDSQDNQIFSYISRKNSALAVTSSSAKTNTVSQQTEPSTFHCHVFKAYKKTQAILIVHGLGRIFELCHSIESKTKNKNRPSNACLHNPCDQKSCGHTKSHDNEADTSYSRSRGLLSDDGVYVKSLDDSVFLRDNSGVSPGSLPVSKEFVKTQQALKRVSESEADCCRNILPNLDEQDSRQRRIVTSKQKSCDDLLLSGNEGHDVPLTQQQEIRLLWFQLEQQERQIGAAVGQTELLRQQVAIETQSRNDAEMRCHQLLLHNKDLLEHINRLVVENKQLREQLSRQQSQEQHNLTQPILASSHTASPNPQPQNGEDRNRSTKTSPDSGHKEMSSRSSQSDLLEEWEKLNTTLNLLATPTNSSYQLSTKFEDEKLQRDLSFTDIALLRASQSQFSEDHSTSQQLAKPTSSTNNIVGNTGLANHNAESFMENVNIDDKLQIANQSFAEMPVETPIIPLSRTPDASKLLRTLMLSECESSAQLSASRSVKRIHQEHIRPSDQENKSTSLNSSVNDIYDKMKVIRRSLENMEVSVGKHISSLTSSPANEFTPQRKLSVASSTPTSQVSTGKTEKQQENLYADISELKNDNSDIARGHLFSGVDTVEDSTYEPIRQREESHKPPTTQGPNEKQPITIQSENKEPIATHSEEPIHMDKGDKPDHDSNVSVKRLKRSKQHHYENVGDNFVSRNSPRSTSKTSLSRNDTYVVRMSALDLHNRYSPRKYKDTCSHPHIFQPMPGGRMSHSCQSLSHSRSSLVIQRYTSAPQKVTTLSSPSDDRAINARNSKRRANDPTDRKEISSGGVSDGETPQSITFYVSKPLTGKKVFSHSVTPIPDSTLRESRRHISRSQYDFRPIAAQSEQTISRDSLNSSMFEAELEKRLERLVDLQDPGQSSC